MFKNLILLEQKFLEGNTAKKEKDEISKIITMYKCAKTKMDKLSKFFNNIQENIFKTFVKVFKS